jgi:hypothetical protein
MSPSLDRTASLRDCPPEQLLASAQKGLEILQALPENDGFHRCLAADLAQEIGLLNRILGSGAPSDSREIQRALDDEREALYAGLAETIRSGRRHPLAAKARAAGRLGALLDHRRSASLRPSVDECTAELKLLFADFDQAPAQSDLVTLDLLTWYDKLKAIHTRYTQTVSAESAPNIKPHESLPALTTAKQRITAILRICSLTVAYQAEQGRAPYITMAEQLDRAFQLPASSAVHRTDRHEEPKGQAALNG